MTTHTGPSVPDLSLEELRERLLQHATLGGHSTVVAAVELLAEHRSWLERPAFREYILHFEDERPPLAKVDWPRVMGARAEARLPNLGSAADKVLLIAASLANRTPVDLFDCLTGLGHAHRDMVQRAFFRALTPL